MQEARSAELENRIGKGQILGELPHDGRQAVVSCARQEQHLCVVEEIAELMLGRAQRPLLYDLPKSHAGTHQGITCQFFEPGGVALMKIAGSDRVVVVHQTEPDGIDLVPPLDDELFGCLEIVIRANTHDFEIVAEEFGPEVTVEAEGT